MIKLNKIKINKTLIYSLLSLVLISAVFFVGVFVGKRNILDVDKITNVYNKQDTTQTDIDFNSFWKAWNILNDKSIYRNDINNQDKLWGAIQGLASSYGDPYTVFFDPKENKSFNEEIKGSFTGIGAEVDIKDEILTIVSPLRNTPAWNAGIKAGDKIVKIDDKTTEGMSVDEAVSLIRGDKGTYVTLTIFREGENKTREIKIIRDIINYPIIETENRDDEIFVIKFYSFSENSFSLFKNAINEFINSGKSKLILDLRGNPGGYLESAVDIASLFIDRGSIVVKEDFGDGEKVEEYRSKGNRIFNENLKMIILVDGGSASASEILSGALSEYNIATLVGEQTFGKGSVQELIPVTDDTSLKVTVAKWLTPNGVSISDKGLTPNIIVPITEEDIKNGNDSQMDKAVEILLKE